MRFEGVEHIALASPNPGEDDPEPDGRWVEQRWVEQDGPSPEVQEAWPSLAGSLSLEGERGAAEPAPIAAPREATRTAADCIDPNTASQRALQRLPRVGPALAGRIEDARPFSRPRDLLRVSGIGPATLAQVEPHLCPFS